jgi:hypothetical protein
MVSHFFAPSLDLHADVAACKAIQFIARGIVPQKKYDAPLHISVVFWERQGTGCSAKRLLSWNNTRQGDGKVALLDSMHERKRRSP